MSEILKECSAAYGICKETWRGEQGEEDGGDMAVKDMAASILTRLKTQAKETGLTYQMCLQLFCQEEFLRKIEASRYSENFILKGECFYTR